MSEGRSSPLRVFLAMFIAAFLIDLTENWEYPVAGVLFTLLALPIFALGMPRLLTCIFLVLSAGQVVIFQFPDAANHNNLYVFFSVFLLLLLARYRHENDAQLAERIFPLARVTLALVYIFAGFHKLNSAFIDSNGSCATAFLFEFLRVYRLQWVPRPEAALVVVPWIIIFWELLGGVLLLFRRTQLPMLVVSWAMHAGLSMLVFFDFSSMAFAFFAAFVPASYWRTWSDNRSTRLGTIGLDRLLLYLILTIGAGVGAGIMILMTGSIAWYDKVQGLALNAGLMILAWPIVRRLLSRGGIRDWSGVQAWTHHAPKWSIALPVFLLLWASQPYLGLRTTGAFTMFSNLITEGPRSNHLLLGSNPIRIFGYQSDAVLVVSIDSRHASSRKKDLNGYLVPVIEFRKQIARWREDGLVGLQAEIEYLGERFITDDIVRENPWGSSERTLEMRVLGFRKVDPAFESCDCSW